MNVVYTVIHVLINKGCSIKQGFCIIKKQNVNYECIIICTISRLVINAYISTLRSCAQWPSCDLLVGFVFGHGPISLANYALKRIGSFERTVKTNKFVR